MSTLTIHLPESIHAEVEKLARRDGITPDQFLAAAAAEKVSALKGVDFLRSEAAQSRVEDWEYVLSRVPAGAPLSGDESAAIVARCAKTLERSLPPRGGILARVGRAAGRK